jgi:cellulose synthase operon protein C
VRIPHPIRFGFVALSFLVVASGCSRSAQSYLDRGTRNLNDGKVDAAVLDLRNAVDKDPMLAPARLKLAEAYLRQGNGAGALAESIRAADLLPKDATAQLKAGALLLAAGRLDDAKARADKVLAANSKNVEAIVLRANSLAGLRDLDGALEQMQQALQLDSRASLQTNLGILQAVRGNLAEAESAFRSAVSADPKSVEARLALGQFLWGTSKAAEAEAEFKAALGLDATSLPANRALALFYLQTDRTNEAEPYFRKAAEASAAVSSKLALADYYAGTKRPADAIAVLEKLGAEQRYWPLAKAKIAGIQQAEGKRDEALRTVDAVIKKYPSLAAAHVVRGSLLLDDNRLDEALKDAQEATKGDPQNFEAQFLLGRIQESKRDLDSATKAFAEALRLNPRAAAAQVRMAGIALQRNSLPSAVQLAEQAANTQPGNLGAQLVLARGVLATGDLDRATAITNGLLKAAPEVGVVQTQAGMLALAKGDKAGARAAFEKALALDSRLVEALSGLVSLDLQEKAPQRARARMEERLKQLPAKPAGGLQSAALALAGRTFAATGDPVKGETYLRQAIAADPSNFEAYSLLGGLLFSQQKLDQAIAEFEKLAARQPGSEGPATMIGLILQAQGKNAEAQARYERLVEANPRAAVASNNLAWMYASRGDQLDRALQLAKAAVAELPENAEVNDTLGYVYIRKQMAALGLPPLRVAVAKDSGNPAIHYHLGLAYEQVGDKPAARQSLERALKLKSDFDGAQDARTRLRTLG